MNQVIQVFPTEPWAKQSNENDLEYEAFKFFRDTQPMERVTVLPEICRKFGLEDYEVKDMARKKHWLIRVRKHDIWLEGSQRQGAIQKRTQLGADMVTLSQKLMKLSEDALTKLTEDKKQPSYREVVEMIRASIQLNQAGFGLQGLAINREVSAEGVAEDSPADLINAAVQVNVMITQKVKGIEVNPDDIIENEPSLEEYELSSET